MFWGIICARVYLTGTRDYMFQTMAGKFLRKQVLNKKIVRVKLCEEGGLEPGISHYHVSRFCLFVLCEWIIFMCRKHSNRMSLSADGKCASISCAILHETTQFRKMNFTLLLLPLLILCLFTHTIPFHFAIYLFFNVCKFTQVLILYYLHYQYRYNPPILTTVLYDELFVSTNIRLVYL